MNYSNENEFLKDYDPEQYSPVAVTVDCVVFGITKVSSENYRKLDKQSLNVLLVKRKDYPSKIAEYTGDMLLVGINYDKETKQHTCKIERWKK